MKRGRLVVKASRWPWQGATHQTRSAWMGRFGGGWDFKLGVAASRPKEYGWTVHIDLLFGSVTFSYRTHKHLAWLENREALEREKEVKP